MIYLIVQMIVALLLAGICGGAIGWLVHRATHTRQVQQLRHALARQQNQLAQSQSEIGMLTDDYEELQRRSQDEVDALKQENEQIPFLNNNLEKSQLLVRQMMQKHEAKVRDLATQNQSLTSKLKNLEDREHAYNTVQAELDRVRRKHQDAPAQKDAPNEPTVSTADNADTVAVSRDKPSEAEALQSVIPAASKFSAVASEQNVSHPPTRISDARSSTSWASAPLSGSDASNETNTSAMAGATASNESTLNPENEAEEIDMDADPFDNVMEVGDELQRELDIDADDDLLLDGSADASSLFEPVEQRDDLKQIFGIGPVTEKALNELGITSYSQLADLKGHDIEKIASALQIVPGRIERDNWVGNARRQLEDVLEQL